MIALNRTYQVASQNVVAGLQQLPTVRTRNNQSMKKINKIPQNRVTINSNQIWQYIKM